MRTTLILIGCSCLLASGCTLIPTDMFPKVRWYWSQDAKNYRAEQHRYDLYNQTNKINNP